MSDSRSCGRCIYYNSITNECGEEPKCMRDVDEAKYTSYIEGKKQGRADAIEEFINEVEECDAYCVFHRYDDFCEMHKIMKKIAEQLKEQKNEQDKRI